MSKVFAGKRSSESRAHLSYLASSAGRPVRNGANLGEPESFSSQNESPMKPVRAAKNIFTSGENTYWEACIGHNKATLKISILIPLLVGAARSLVERTRHQIAVLQILREQTELADSDRHGRGLSNPPHRRLSRHPREAKYRDTYRKWVTASADRPGFPPLPPPSRGKPAPRLPAVALDRGFASGFLLSHERHGPLCAQLATGR